VLTHSSIGPYLHVQLAIGTLLHDSFDSIDTHLPLDARVARVTRDVIRFLEKLFADQLLFWERIDGGGKGWRECATSESLEPLVADIVPIGRICGPVRARSGRPFRPSSPADILAAIATTSCW
jgi:hypothetical protein